MKFLFLALTILTITNTFAKSRLNRSFGEWGSGGGNSVVCFFDTLDTPNILKTITENDNTIPDEYLSYIESIEMYDLYEAKKKRGLSAAKPEIIEIGENEKIYNYIDRLGKRYKGRVELMSRLLDYGKELIPDSQFVFHEFAVEYQNDLGSVTLPNNNCIISTMAAQVNESDYFMVHIDERLYNHPMHSYQSRATLILHELVYGVFRKMFEHKTSGKTRNVVRYLLSYHKSITEGKIANSLYSMGLLKPFELYEQQASRYYLSTISSEIFAAVYDVHAGFKAHYEAAQDIFFKQNLYKNIKEKAHRSGIDLSDVPATILGYHQFLSRITNEASDSEWRHLNFEFRYYIQMDIRYSMYTYETSVKYALESVKNNTYISERGFKQFEERISNFFENYLNISDETFDHFITEVYSNRNIAVNLQREIEETFFELEICTGSYDDVVVINPLDEQCFSPIKLNNIIPR